MNYFEHLYETIKSQDWYREKFKNQLCFDDSCADEGSVEDREYKDAQTYFSIGQDDDAVKNNYCWIYRSGLLEVAKGMSHNFNFGHGATSGLYFRGWYDRSKRVISLVPTERLLKRFHGEFKEDDIPNDLYRQLKAKFRGAPIIVFN